MSNPRELKLSVGLALIVLVGAGAVMLPGLSRLRSLSDTRTDLEDRAARRDDGAAALRTLSAERDRMMRLVAARVTPMPRDSDIASLIRELSRNLDQIGLGRREITTGSAIEMEDVTAMPMSVTIEGRFPQIFAAIQWIENLPRLIRVDRLRLERPTNRRAGDDDLMDPDAIRAELMLQVFFSEDDAEVGVALGDGGG